MAVLVVYRFGSRRWIFGFLDFSNLCYLCGFICLLFIIIIIISFHLFHMRRFGTTTTRTPPRCATPCLPACMLAFDTFETAHEHTNPPRSTLHARMLACGVGAATTTPPRQIRETCKPADRCRERAVLRLSVRGRTVQRYGESCRQL